MLYMIGDEAFMGCAALSSITLPDSLVEIGMHAFAECTSLLMIHYGGTQDAWETVMKAPDWCVGTPEELTVLFVEGVPKADADE